MHALLIGATGATGSDLLDRLLKDPAFDRVDIFVRRKPDLQHAKLSIHVIDFDKPETWQQLVKGDVLFSCLGTTLKAAGSKEAQWKIDHDYQYQFAKAAADNHVARYVLVSSAYASPDARLYYPRMKGKLEEAVKALGFSRIVIFRPPTLIRKGTDRPMEGIAVKVLQFFSQLGIFRSQRPLPTEILAQAMINVSKTNDAGMVIYEASDIWGIAKPGSLKVE
jgi:uncharacterized protein YbjT (DUF2867 family)